MRFRFNPEPFEMNGSRRSIMRTNSATAEVTTLAVATTAGAIVGALMTRSQPRGIGIGAVVGFGAAIALIATSEEY